MGRSGPRGRFLSREVRLEWWRGGPGWAMVDERPRWSPSRPPVDFDGPPVGPQSSADRAGGSAFLFRKAHNQGEAVKMFLQLPVEAVGPVGGN